MINRLKSIFRKIDFINGRYNDDECVSFSILDSNAIKIKFHPRHKVPKSGEINHYKAYPIIKYILDVLGIEYQRLYDIEIVEINNYCLEMNIYFYAAYCYVEDENTSRVSDDVEIPTPISQEEKDAIKEKVLKEKMEHLNNMIYGSSISYSSYGISVEDYLTSQAPVNTSASIWIQPDELPN